MAEQMKTRVVRFFDQKNAVYMFTVQKWDLWDAPDLREYYPNDRDWRFVTTVGDEETATRIAWGVSENPSHPGYEVIAEFPKQ